KNEITAIQDEREDGIRADHQTSTDDHLKKPDTGHDVSTTQDQGAHDGIQDLSISTSSDLNERVGSIASARPEATGGASTRSSDNVTTSSDLPEAVIDTRQEGT